MNAEAIVTIVSFYLLPIKFATKKQRIYKIYTRKQASK